MNDPDSMDQLERAMDDCVASDSHLLDELRNEVRGLRTQVRRIQPRSATAISLVGTTAATTNSGLILFLSNSFELLTPARTNTAWKSLRQTPRIEDLESRHLDADGKRKTPLGRMMNYLGTTSLKLLIEFCAAL